MKIIDTKRSILYFLIGFSIGSLLYVSKSVATEPYICNSTYALCTSATCFPLLGEPKKVICRCIMKAGYSMGYKPCQNPQKGVAGHTLIVSRFYPLSKQNKYTLLCKKGYAWADCLDKPCYANVEKKGQALCTCDVKHNKPFGFFVENCEKTKCTSGIYSAILSQQAEEIEKLLYSQRLIPKLNPQFCPNNNQGQ
ncbi:MAG: hypothetical protein A3F41_05230 [Coxiella sp. RIFCSPHIGHO2_12_FULL_44_14]|nr:MAG: hypothetical protein A3F41_05230 [Coxiella sp. RIFCSPHIGHO2_12_FULL_44_14]